MKPKKHKTLIISIILFLLCLILFLYPDTSSKGTKLGISNCINIVIPSLFPFMFLTILLTESGYIFKIFSFPSKIISKITGIDKEYCSIFLLSMIGGYPSGAKTLSILVENNKISPKTAEYMLCFCTNAGPAFLISAVGASMFMNKSVGFILYFSNFLSCFTIMVYLKNKLPPIKLSLLSEKNSNILQFLVSSIQNTCKTLVTLSSFIILFSVVISFIPQSTPNHLKNLFLSLCEVTSSCLFNSSELNKINIILVSFICGFSGLCIILQIFSICNKQKIKISRFIIFRFYIGILNAIYTFLLLLIFPISLEGTFINNSQGVISNNSLAPMPALILLICCVYFPIYINKLKKI